MKISTIVCDFSNVTVGNKVYSIRHDEGTVRAVFENVFYVNFGNFSVRFAFDGSEAEYQDKHPSLFWTEPELVKLP